MIIYRVEDSNGNGYTEWLEGHINNFTSYGVIMSNPDYMTKRPLPEDDGIYMVNSYHLFGFKHLEDITKWFGDAQLVLGKYLGGKIVILDVPDSHVIVGGRQVAFDSREATLIDTKPMDYFLRDSVRYCLFDFKEQVQESLELEMEIPKQLEFLINKGE